MRTTSRLSTALAAVALAGTLLAGCGSASSPSPPSGIDLLVVPTPSPRPADFVRGIDNPWLAWQPGSTAVYDVSGPGGSSPGAPGAAVGGTASVTVGTSTVPVAGLEATPVTTTGPGPGGETSTVDHYAQDVDGNVWWVGREGQWEAGLDGAAAGLLMPARPRVGDGFRTALVAGLAEERVEVLEAPLRVPGAQDEPFATVRVESRSDVAPGAVEERTYVEGRGLLRLSRTAPGTGASYVWELQGS